MISHRLTFPFFLSLATISLGGGLQVQMAITDRGEPGSADTIAITLWDGNTLLFSSNWSGASTLEQILDGGNLQVRGADDSGGSNGKGNGKKK